MIDGIYWVRTWGMREGHEPIIAQLTRGEWNFIGTDDSCYDSEGKVKVVAGPLPPLEKCSHVSRILFESPETLIDHPRISWCTACGVLLDTDTEELIAGPADYRARWAK